jgi:hypothetical protein
MAKVEEGAVLCGRSLNFCADPDGIMFENGQVVSQRIEGATDFFIPGFGEVG